LSYTYVYWYGIDDEHQTKFVREQLATYPVVGGHKPLHFYPADLAALYTAVIREPVSRVASLYSYYAKPEFAQSRSSRERHFETWQARGIDSNSLVKSLQNCAEFRREVENFQCGYLSRHGADFAGVMATLADTQAFICTSDKTAQMNAQLGNLLGWFEIPNQTLNRSKKNSEETILSEPGAREAIAELVMEDQKLYDFIAAEHEGVYSHLVSSPSEWQTLQVSDAERARRFWNKVNIYTKGYIGVNPAGLGSTGIVICNESSTDISPELLPNLLLAYELIGEDGTPLTPEPLYIELNETVATGGRLFYDLQIEVPTQLVPALARIAVGLAKGEPVSRLNSLHQAYALVVKVDH